MSQVKLQSENLKEAEEKRKKIERPIIQAIQQEIDNSAKKMATKNSEYQKQKHELKKQFTELEAKNMQENAYFVKEMTRLKEQLKEKINWDQVDHLVLGKKLVNASGNPIGGNRWDLAETKNTSISISANATSYTDVWKSVYAEKGFVISAACSGPLLFYFEVAIMAMHMEMFVGLSSRNIPDGYAVGELENSYGIGDDCDDCLLSGKRHDFDWPNDAIKPEWDPAGDVFGCGLLLNPEKKLSIFFTANGLLMGKHIPINPTADTLYPTISMHKYVSFETNFGGNPANPFKYDIEKLQEGMVFE